MSDDLIAAFLPKFIALAQTRLARALELARQPSGDAAIGIARELHALAGEAGLLGLSQVFPLARETEVQVKRLQAPWSEADAASVVASLESLRRAVELVQSPQPDGATT